MGCGDRDRYIENYCQTLRNLAKAGIDCVCYNFMPVFDWTRSDLSHRLADGSNALIYDDETVQRMDPVKGELSLPGWYSSYTKEDMVHAFILGMDTYALGLIKAAALIEDGRIDEFYSDSLSDAPLANLAHRAYLVKGEDLFPWS